MALSVLGFGIALYGLRTVLADALVSAVHADAFTSVPYAGNPACVVVLGKPASADWMQKVALEMHLSETAFLVPRDDAPSTSFDLRWFTPTDEVDLCGHATLASSHVLWEQHGCDAARPLEFHTRSGTLIASRDADGFIELDFPTAPATPVPADDPDRAQLLAAFPNLTPEDILYVGRNEVGGPGGGDVIVEVTPGAFRALEYVPSEVRKVVCRVLSVTAAGCPALPEPGRKPGEYDFSSRGFAPCVGVDEDPVCGSAHTMLGPYWASKLGTVRLLARAASPRGGDVRVHVKGERTVLGGQAVTTLLGQLLHGD